ncbi:helix-turn-helix domain-containing protein [Algibacillus agarilyticus]|uniref:helix-turn-helix domain-containing protein n=1 Tax=Algibacillus agarilyticus TaxID=2234133 RepID=UPI000DD0DCC6|nr:helix-turn-helix domain-containing protein [Algibacillus agarilyticus]
MGTYYYGLVLAVSYFLDGKNRAEIARILKVSRRSVNDWVSNYLASGLKGLETKKQKGREPYLSEQQQQQLREFITESSQSDCGGRLIGADIHAYIVEHFDINYHSNSIYRLLNSLGFSWITSRSRHPKHQ